MGADVTKKTSNTQGPLLISPIYDKSNVGQNAQMDIRTIRLANLETLLKEISKAELARLIGKKPNYLSQIHRPETGKATEARPMGYATARRIEAAMKRPHGWMDQDHSLALSSNADPVMRTRKVPIIGWDQVRSRDRMDVDFLADSMDEDMAVIYASESVGVGAFALRVRGDSMVDTTGGTGFPDGSIIVVDPTVETLPGDAVVVQLSTATEAVFKILEFDGERRFLKPLNARYPIVALPDDAQIVGRVVLVQSIVPPSLRR